MKCDNCRFRKYHSAGSWRSVAEGGDDPYNYEYCEKGHWIGDSSEPQSKEAENMEDQFINCTNYELIKSE